MVCASLVQAQGFPSHQGLSSDFAQRLTIAQEQELEARLSEIEKTTKATFVVVIVDSLGTYPDKKDYAVNLFKAWGIGKKGEDNGLLLLVLTQPSGNERAGVWFEVGYGLEGVVTDGTTGAIARQMVPHMRRGDWNGGIKAGVDAMEPFLRKYQLERSNVPESPVGGPPWPVLWVTMVVFSAAVMASYLLFRRRPGPYEYRTTRETASTEPSKIRYHKTYPWPEQGRYQQPQYRRSPKSIRSDAAQRTAAGSRGTRKVGGYRAGSYGTATTMGHDTGVNLDQKVEGGGGSVGSDLSTPDSYSGGGSGGAGGGSDI